MLYHVLVSLFASSRLVHSSIGLSPVSSLVPQCHRDSPSCAVPGMIYDFTSAAFMRFLRQSGKAQKRRHDVTDSVKGNIKMQGSMGEDGRSG